MKSRAPKQKVPVSTNTCVMQSDRGFPRKKVCMYATHVNFLQMCSPRVSSHVSALSALLLSLHPSCSYVGSLGVFAQIAEHAHLAHGHQQGCVCIVVPIMTLLCSCGSALCSMVSENPQKGVRRKDFRRFRELVAFIAQCEARQMQLPRLSRSKLMQPQDDGHMLETLTTAHQRLLPRRQSSRTTPRSGKYWIIATLAGKQHCFIRRSAKNV